MKKIPVLLFVLVLVTGFTFAEDIGLTAGLEFGINDVNEEDRTPYVTAILEYETTFLNDALSLFTELNYTIAFSDDTPMDLYWDLELGYSFSFGRISTISFLLKNELFFMFTPESDTYGIIAPGIEYFHNTRIGDVYLNVFFPISFASDDHVGMDFTIGWVSKSGSLGLELLATHTISPDLAYTNKCLTVFYKTGPVYFEVETWFPESISTSGITITPWLEYYYNAFTFYTYCEFGGLGADVITVSPALGVKYSF